MCTDNSFEFSDACEEVNWNHKRSTPRRSRTNGMAEGAVRRVKEGTASVLVQLGHSEGWCYSSLQTVQDLLTDGQDTLGTSVQIHTQGRMHQFVSKVLPGILISCALNAKHNHKAD